MIKKKERGLLDKIKNAHVGFIHLAPPKGHCLAADSSQFVFRGAQKEVLLSHFGQARDLSST